MDRQILRAIEVAAANHEGQRYGDVAYIVHPLTVGMMLLSAGASVTVVVAGILHDALEDTDLTYEAIEADFGPAVARLVSELTRGDETYDEYLDGITSSEARLVKCVDSVLNLAGLSSLECAPERRAKLSDRYVDNIERFGAVADSYGIDLPDFARKVMGHASR